MEHWLLVRHAVFDNRAVCPRLRQQRDPDSSIVGSSSFIGTFYASNGRTAVEQQLRAIERVFHGSCHYSHGKGESRNPSSQRSHRTYGKPRTACSVCFATSIPRQTPRSPTQALSAFDSRSRQLPMSILQRRWQRTNH